MRLATAISMVSIGRPAGRPAGNDRRAYLAGTESAAGANADRIADFTSGDILDLSAIDAIANANANAAGINDEVGCFEAVARAHGAPFMVVRRSGASEPDFRRRAWRRPHFHFGEGVQLVDRNRGTNRMDALPPIDRRLHHSLGMAIF